MVANPKDKINLKNPWHFLATGFGSGLSPVIPGTMGTVAAIPLYLLMAQLPFTAYLVIIVVAALIGITICQKTSDDMGAHDHGSIVWDEFVGFWITMAIAPVVSWQWVLAGFVLFRFFDMVKPWPISWLDKHVHGGLGIMVDDILAGFMAMIALWGLGHWLGW
ncbi:phosphatidylglycerophosphatase A [Photobacterium sp. ZSDE20]|uniref:Phosphatidylglycerophosphatase A n=1 Tax=Photobacterium pectinilyticum TaxID=2906793 RepID=A0ABT1MX49_9GAMM|nr:phosphatidylglycerophosphatase A [Photobacterium sp. ZSDE20]MCQ1057065.1 phosphatidylglycerophosphatase A [Photobacterium sp. ZSDE20]MDD1821200.1 phosphatidylglycerophosphatase A [Photobacterium sp. ZSDE20]